MKKLVFSLLTAILAVCNINAQSSLVATLNHDGNITAYYGTNALSEAHTAAVNGDIITLSSGTFVACDITKAITIRGAGMEYNDGIEPTRMETSFAINVAIDSTYVLTMEGIYHTGTINLVKANKPLFFKCRLGAINTYGGSYGDVMNASFIHCKISTSFFLHLKDKVFFDNCFINNPTKYCWSSTSNDKDPQTNYYFTNCVVRLNNNYKVNYYSNFSYYPAPSNITYSYLKNCIIYSTIDSTFPSSTTMYNNISNKECFANALNTTNTVVSDFSTLFKTWTGGGYDDEEKFDLTDTAATTYLGSDGKQVGIYGGSLPYDPIPTQPKITKCDVAAKTTADGKLSVDIEVEGADY